MLFRSKNYGDFLLKTIDGIKDQFSADELKLLNKGAEEIKEIEGKLTVLEQKFPGCGEKPSDGDMSVPAENGKPIEKDNLMKFPTFDGKDLDGNEVKSSTLFAKNTVTVVNFWFTTCNPCVEELADLEVLNKQLAKKGGAVVGIIQACILAPIFQTACFAFSLITKYYGSLLENYLFLFYIVFMIVSICILIYSYREYKKVANSNQFSDDRIKKVEKYIKIQPITFALFLASAVLIFAF